MLPRIRLHVPIVFQLRRKGGLHRARCDARALAGDDGGDRFADLRVHESAYRRIQAKPAARVRAEQLPEDWITAPAFADARVEREMPWHRAGDTTWSDTGHRRPGQRSIDARDEFRLRSRWRHAKYSTRANQLRLQPILPSEFRC